MRIVYIPRAKLRGAAHQVDVLAKIGARVDREHDVGSARARFCDVRCAGRDRRRIGSGRGGCGAGRWQRDGGVSGPAAGVLTSTALGHGDEGGKGPGEVVSGNWVAGKSPVELLGKRAVGGRVLLGDGDKRVGIGGCGAEDLRKGVCGAIGTVALDISVGLGFSVWVEILEEGE